jgi:predicted O-methyltransferase YrrM
VGRKRSRTVVDGGVKAYCKMNTPTKPEKSLARMALHTSHGVMRTLFFGRLVDRMKRTGPIEDLDALVKLATRGFWHGITPIQNPREILDLLRVLKQASPRTILEIGTARGGTLFLFTRIAAADAQLVSIDLPEGPGGGGYPHWKLPLYQAFPLPGQRLELIRDDSHDLAVLAHVAKLVGDRGLDLLFIDGDHSYNGVKSDFEMYGSLVNPAGLIAFHDIDYSRDVRQLWDEIKVGRHFQEIRDDHGQTFGIGLIYN